VIAIRFEWDEAKNRSTRRKHGVGFEEASQVFFDPFCISVRDRIEGGEQRWRTIGMVEGLLLVMVAHTVREEHDDGTSIEVIRIISARHATRKEKRRYEEENG
jgi:uncharacterized protein